MGTNRMSSFALGLAAFALVAAAAAQAFGAGEVWRISQVSASGTYCAFDQMSGDRLVWAVMDGPSWQVATRKIGDAAPTMLTSTPGTRSDINVSGDRVVWVAPAPVNNQVFTWKLGDPAPTQLVTNPNDHHDARVSSDRIVWDAFSGTGWWVYSWKVGDPSIQTTVSMDPMPAGNQLSPQVSGDRIVWTQSDGVNNQVFTWKLGSGLTTLTSDPHAHYGAVVSGDRVAWMGEDGLGGWQVYTQVVGESPVTALTSGLHEYGGAQVSGDRVVWTGDDASGHIQAYTWKSGETQVTTLTAASQDQEAIRVDGERVVWFGRDDAGNRQVVEWKVGDAAPTTLTANPFDSTDVRVAGDRIIWTGQVGSLDSRIYLADAGPKLRATLSKPSVAPGTPTHGKTATFSANLTPGAASGGTTMMYLYRWETKTVRKKVAGKWRRVKVKYWRSRGSVRMLPTAAGSSRLVVKTKLKYTGSWKALATFGGDTFYGVSIAPARTFKVK